MPKIVSKLPDVGTTIFTVMSRLAEDCGAINLSQGFPDYQPPLELLERVLHGLATHAGSGHEARAPHLVLHLAQSACECRARGGRAWPGARCTRVSWVHAAGHGRGTVGGGGAWAGRQDLSAL